MIFTVLEDVAIEAPEFVVQEIENTVCPEIGKGGTLVPLGPLNESPFVLEIVQSDTPVVPQLTNVDSPLRTNVGTTRHLSMFEEPPPPGHIPLAGLTEPSGQ